MGSNLANRFTVIELMRRMNYQQEKSRANTDHFMISRVKRNLFSCNPETDVKPQVVKEMAEIAKYDKQKWNFDFKKGKPVANPDAKFKWENSVNMKEDEPFRQTKITDYFLCGKRKSDSVIGRKAKQQKTAIYNGTGFKA